MRIQRIILGCLVAMTISVAALANNGAGNVMVGYCFIDEEGNRSVNHSTFHDYEGIGLSLEKFRYSLQNGLRINADLRNMTLNNRNMTLAIAKPGLFGAEFLNNQFRRIYDSTGGSFTRRNRTEGSLWFYPQRYLKIFGGGSLINLTGKTVDSFNESGFGSHTEMDYGQKALNVGLRGNYQGRMLQAEYRTVDYKDNKLSSRDQARYQIRLDALTPIPYYERVVLSGGFRHFQTKYSDNDFKISANTVWGGARAKISPVVYACYNFLFDRAGSDSDRVATDNLAQAAYLTYENPMKAGVTAGYQFDVGDDFEDEVKANSYYFSGWCKALREFEFRFEYGSRIEDIDGARLLGDESRTRYKTMAKYTKENVGSLSLKYEWKQRKNNQINSKADYSQIVADFSLLKYQRYFNLSGGYSFSNGNYKNREKNFQFKDHLLYGDIGSKEFHHFSAGFGGQYYRNKRDLDVESFSLHFETAYQFFKNYRIEAIYNVHNFDDFLVTDQYFTANIVEVNLIKKLSF